MKQKKLQITFILLNILILSSSIQKGSCFTEWFSDRYNLQFNEPLPYVYGWPVLLISNISQIIEFSSKNIWILSTNVNESLQIVNQLDSQGGSSLLRVNGIDSIRQNSLIYKLSAQQFIIVETNQITSYNCSDSLNCKQTIKTLVNFNSSKQINQILQTKNSSILVATDKGLFLLSNDTFQKKSSLFNNYSIQDIKYSANLGVLAINTKSGVPHEKLILYFENTDTWRFEYTNYQLDTINQMIFRNRDNTLWITGRESITVLAFETSRRSSKQQQYQINKIGFKQGLPVGNLTKAACSGGGRLYFGGQTGIASYFYELADILPDHDGVGKKTWQGIGQIGSALNLWRHFNQQRWLPSGDIQYMFIDSSDSLYVSTSQGLAKITHDTNYNHSQKVEIADDIVRKRHSTNGICSDSDLQKPGDLSSSVQSDTDNDGFWTSMYFGSQIYKYKLTQNQTLKEEIKTTFQSLKRMYQVIPDKNKGLMAKGVQPRGPLPSPQWFYSEQPGFTQWMYKSNTSSDDVTGYYFGLPLYIDYVCETEIEKKEALDLLISTTDYIMKNNFTLMNVDGYRTHWGFWDPYNLNEVPEHYGERSSNTIEILSFLAVTYHYTKDAKYLQAMYTLGVDNQYIDTIINGRINQPGEENYSDDELLFLAFHAFFFVANKDHDIPKLFKDAFKLSIKNSWYSVSKYNPSLYTYITALSLIHEPDLKQIVNDDQLNAAEFDLQDMSSEWINWSVVNSQRLDVAVNQEYVLIDDKNKITNDLLRRNERASHCYWNSHQYDLDDFDNGYGETAPFPYLLPYWIGQYYKNITANSYQYQQQQQNNLFNQKSGIII